MAGPFYCEIDRGGARVMVEDVPLTAGCLSDGEVDRQIGRLIASLEWVRQQMKDTVATQRGQLLVVDAVPRT